MANIVVIMQILVILWWFITDIKFIFWYYQEKYNQIISYDLNKQLIAFFVTNIILKLINMNDIITTLAIAYYISLGMTLISGWLSVVIVSKSYKMKKVQDGLLDRDEVERKKETKNEDLYWNIYLYYCG